MLLDAHPDIACPAEAGIPNLIRTVGAVWWTITPSGERSPEGILPEEAVCAIREAAVGPMRAVCERHGKAMYCDKSLDSVQHLGVVENVLPGTRAILLFRHVWTPSLGDRSVSVGL